VPRHIHACTALIYPATHVDSSYSLITGLAYQHAPLIASDVFGHREVAERQAGIALFRVAMGVIPLVLLSGFAGFLLALRVQFAKQTAMQFAWRTARVSFNLLPPTQADGSQR
jgi:hypothetical protein